MAEVSSIPTICRCIKFRVTFLDTLRESWSELTGEERRIVLKVLRNDETWIGRMAEVWKVVSGARGCITGRRMDEEELQGKWNEKRNELIEKGGGTKNETNKRIGKKKENREPNDVSRGSVRGWEVKKLRDGIKFETSPSDVLNRDFFATGASVDHERKRATFLHNFRVRFEEGYGGRGVSSASLCRHRRPRRRRRLQSY